MEKRTIINAALVIVASYWLAYSLIYQFGDPVRKMIEGLLGTFIILVPAMLAMSWAMFTYVDNMAKELTDLRKDVDRKKFVRAQAALESLKKEVLINAGLVVATFLLERSCHFVSEGITPSVSPSIGWLAQTSSAALRFVFFVISVWATANQLNGFLTASSFRTLIATNRK